MYATFYHARHPTI